MKIAKHQIRRQVLEVQTNSEKLGKRLNKELGSFYQSDLLPYLERILDKHVDKDEVISLPRLEIEIDGMTDSNWTRVLPGRFAKAFDTEVKRLKQEQTQKVTRKKDDPVQTALQYLDYILTHGTSPWWGMEYKDIPVTSLFVKQWRKEKQAVHSLLKGKMNLEVLEKNIAEIGIVLRDHHKFWVDGADVVGIAPRFLSYGAGGVDPRFDQC